MRPLALPLAVATLIGQAAAADRESPPCTVGAKPPADAVVLFDGADLSGWVKADGKTPAAWPVEDGLLIVGTRQGDIRTEATFDSFRLHVEFNVPYLPDRSGQARGNSGVYLQGRYELQVLDSYGLIPKDNDCGAIYKQVAPATNACKPPLQWQTYDITFHAAKREGDKVVQKARVTVVQNGTTIIDDREIDPTPGGTGGKAGTPGPILLQDHGNKVQYRNLWLVPIAD